MRCAEHQQRPKTYDGCLLGHMREGIPQQVRAILSDVLLIGHTRVLRVEWSLDVIAFDQEEHARKKSALSFEACLRVSAASVSCNTLTYHFCVRCL